MTRVYAFDGIVPVVHPTAFIHPTATLIGDVFVEEGCYVGPAACLRGDFGRLIMRAGSNVQDGCVLHAGPRYDTVVGANAIISHGAILHGCEIGPNVLIGMNAVVLDGAVIGALAFVGAMSLVKQGFRVPPKRLAMGAPARVKRALGDDEIERLKIGAAAYREIARRSRRALRSRSPLRTATQKRLNQRAAPFDG